MPSPLLIRLLGPPEIYADGERLDVSASRAVPIVALLAAAQGRVKREHVASLLWRRVEASSALASLRQVLHHLPGPLRDAITAERSSLALDPSRVSCDLWRLNAATDVDGLLAGYPAPLLGAQAFDDLPEFDDWLRLERARIAAKVRSAVLLEMERAGPDAALVLARRWLLVEPADEEVHAKVMSLHVAAGRIASAEAQYEALGRILATTSGRAPQPALREILERALRKHGLRGSGLPALATSFVGRQDELAEIARLMADPHCRLVTLHGPGGVGKTRLALAFAEEAARHGEPVRYAGLEAAYTEQAFYSTLAGALEIELAPRQSPRVRVLEGLTGQRGLLVLDNFEQLLPGDAHALPEAVTFVAEMLRAAPQLKVLITSRVALGLQEEWLVPVAGLPFPEESTVAAPADAAVELFVSRARQAYRGFSGTVERPHIIAICRASEGLPLALELAAAQVGNRPCAEIAQDLLAEPGNGPRALNRPDRQASVLRVIEQSLAAASEEQARAFEAMSLFQGAFSATQAFAVARIGEGLLADLAGRALLQRSGADFRMHPLLRQVGAKRLQRRRSVARRVEAGYVEEVARRAKLELDRMLGREAAAALATVPGRFDDEMNALRLAAGHADRAGIEILSTALVYVAVARGLVRACQAAWPDPAAAGLDPESRALLHARRGDLHRHCGDFKEAIGEYVDARAAIEGLDCPRVRVAILTGESGIQVWSGQYAEAVETCEAALAIPIEHSSLAIRMRLIASLGTALAELGQHERAQAVLDAATAEALEAGLSASVLALVLNASGGVCQYRGDLRRCVAVHRQALELLEADGFRQMRSTHLCNLGGALIGLEDYAAAETVFEQAVEIAQVYGDRGPLTYSLIGLANVAYGRGDFALTERQAADARASARRIGSAALDCEAATLILRSRMRRGDLAGARAIWQEQERDSRDKDLGFRRLEIAYSALQLAALSLPVDTQALARGVAGLLAEPTCTSTIRNDLKEWARGRGMRLPAADAGHGLEQVIRHFAQEIAQKGALIAE